MTLMTGRFLIAQLNGSRKFLSLETGLAFANFVTTLLQSIGQRPYF
jgi:hypothetical protein